MAEDRHPLLKISKEPLNLVPHTEPFGLYTLIQAYIYYKPLSTIILGLLMHSFKAFLMNVRTLKAIARTWTKKRTSIFHCNGGPTIRGPYSIEPAKAETYSLSNARNRKTRSTADQDA